MEVLRTTGIRVGSYTLRIVATVAGVGVTLVILRPVRQALYARLHARSRNVYRQKMEERKQEFFAPLRESIKSCADGRQPLDVVYLGTSLVENVGLCCPAECSSCHTSCVTTQLFRGKDVRRVQAELPHVQLVRARVEDMTASVPDESVDVVVSMLVLCSVTDLEKALREIHRVLRKGGRLYFVEHVAAKKLSVTSRLQKRYRLWWGMAMYGCKLDRKVWKSLEPAGFTQVHYERFAADVDLGAARYLGAKLGGWLNGALEYMIGPHVMGTAVKGTQDGEDTAV